MQETKNRGYGSKRSIHVRDIRYCRRLPQRGRGAVHKTSPRNPSLQALEALL